MMTTAKRSKNVHGHFAPTRGVIPTSRGHFALRVANTRGKLQGITRGSLRSKQSQTDRLRTLLTRQLRERERNHCLLLMFLLVQVILFHLVPYVLLRRLCPLLT